jgi:tetratricopeptide (TPR) repeat protein
LTQAEDYYARCVAVGDQLGNNPAVDAEFQRCLADARRILADFRADKAAQNLDEKDRQGVLKFEEAQVEARKGAPAAVKLFEEAIALWEEILPQATEQDYRRLAVAQLATAYLNVGELRQHRGQRREAQAALLKSIQYGEEAVKLAPDRPLVKQYLEEARQMLESQREEELQDDIDRLCTAERFADAVDLWEQRIKEQEELLRTGEDREAVSRCLAGRLTRLAWFLAHCPDGRVRDTKTAVKRAHRATDLQPDVPEHWYTLAMVQYRNRDWRDSLASLDQVHAHQGDLTGSNLLLIAMNHHQLKQRDEAKQALQKAVKWIDDRKRQAEDNPALRLRYEMMRPSFDSLRREAENLLEGKDPAARGDA